MGFFSRYTDKEQALLDLYSHLISMNGIPHSEAKKNAKGLLDQAIEESKKEGTYYFPENLGDIILGNVSASDPAIQQIAESVRQKLPKKREEGVKDDDLRWWWNLNDIERRMMISHDDVAKYALVVGELRNSTESTKENAMEKAVAKIPRFHPIYGDPTDTSRMKGDRKSVV